MQAPSGGITSNVNGQFYEGGQFIPDHGKYCGKGKNRVTQAAFDDMAKLAEAKGLILVYREKYDTFGLFRQTGHLVVSSKKLANLACYVRPDEVKTVNVNPI